MKDFLWGIGTFLLIPLWLPLLTVLVACLAFREMGRGVRELIEGDVS